MIVDGKTIARELLETVRERIAVLPTPPRLTIITCDPNGPTQRYLKLKVAKGAALGIEVTVRELPAASGTDELVSAVVDAVPLSDGIIVQLPLPPQVDAEVILAAIPESHDVDGLHFSGTSSVLPPVLGAILTIAAHHQVTFEGKNTVVLGRGRLVGAPFIAWAAVHALNTTVLDEDTPIAKRNAALKTADILVLGAGVSGLVTPALIKPGVVIFDAGTSEQGGQLRGDADPACAEVAALLTPVPGGIGPLTLAVLFGNLVFLHERNQNL